MSQIDFQIVLKPLLFFNYNYFIQIFWMQPSSIFLTEYIKIITASDITDQDLGTSIAFPLFNEDLILKLLDETLTILKTLCLVYELKSDIYIVGDLHGNIRDLIRILRQINFFDSEARILFLGDYVDRGDFSLEVITLLFSLICQYPNRIYLLRGNHEFSNVNDTYGFKEQLHNLYKNDNFWNKFNLLFDFLPIAAIIDNNTFCVHGGISSHLHSIPQIETFERPIITFQGNDLLADLMWSDPSARITYYQESERGYGCNFGFDAVFEFCRNQNMERLIRAHQCVKNGIEFILNGKVITVFSCSNYCDTCKNKAGYLYINKKEVNPFHLQPLEILKREKSLFIEVAKRCEDLENVEILHNTNLNLIGNSLNTGFRPTNLKLIRVKRRSSFGQPLSRAVPFPLAVTHMASNEQFYNNRRSFVSLSPKESKSDHEVSMGTSFGCSLKTSKASGNALRSPVSSLPKAYDNSPMRTSNIPPLPPIDDNQI